MVDQNNIFEITKELELYILNLNEYKFNGTGYELILFVPIVRRNEQITYNLILSASVFDKFSKKEIISGVYSWLYQKLKKQLVDKIESIIIVNSNAPFIRNIKFTIPVVDDIIELNDYELGGINIYRGFLISSNISNQLKNGNALTVKLNDGNVINMGIKEIIKNKTITIEYYTGKGLRALFPKSGKKEDSERAKELRSKEDSFLIQDNYIDFIELSEIRSIK